MIFPRNINSDSSKFIWIGNYIESLTKASVAGMSQEIASPHYDTLQGTSAGVTVDKFYSIRVLKGSLSPFWVLPNPLANNVRFTLGPHFNGFILALTDKPCAKNEVGELHGVGIFLWFGIQKPDGFIPPSAFS